MNFLAHYHTAHTSITSYELLGLILPDLVHDFSKLYNVHREAIFASENDFLLAIRNGIALHIKGDEIFHKHYTFVENEQFAKSLLLEANTLTVKRKFIIAHVMVELIIDQYIICVKGYA